MNINNSCINKADRAISFGTVDKLLLHANVQHRMQNWAHAVLSATVLSATFLIGVQGNSALKFLTRIAEVMTKCCIDLSYSKEMWMNYP